MHLRISSCIFKSMCSNYSNKNCWEVFSCSGVCFSNVSSQILSCYHFLYSFCLSSPYCVGILGKKCWSLIRGKTMRIPYKRYIITASSFMQFMFCGTSAWCRSTGHVQISDGQCISSTNYLVCFGYGAVNSFSFKLSFFLTRFFVFFAFEQVRPLQPWQ